MSSPSLNSAEGLLVVFWPHREQSKDVAPECSEPAVTLPLSCSHSADLYGRILCSDATNGAIIVVITDVGKKEQSGTAGGSCAGLIGLVQLASSSGSGGERAPSNLSGEVRGTGPRLPVDGAKTGGSVSGWRVVVHGRKVVAACVTGSKMCGNKTQRESSAAGRSQPCGSSSSDASMQEQGWISVSGVCVHGPRQSKTNTRGASAVTFVRYDSCSLRTFTGVDRVPHPGEGLLANTTTTCRPMSLLATGLLVAEAVTPRCNCASSSPHFVRQAGRYLGMRRWLDMLLSSSTKPSSAGQSQQTGQSQGSGKPAKGPSSPSTISRSKCRGAAMHKRGAPPDHWSTFASKLFGLIRGAVHSLQPYSAIARMLLHKGTDIEHTTREGSGFSHFAVAATVYRIKMDTICGVCLAIVVVLRVVPFILASLSTVQDVFVATHLAAVSWLMGFPAGIKANAEVNTALGGAISYYLATFDHLWLSARVRFVDGVWAQYHRQLVSEPPRDATSATLFSCWTVDAFTLCCAAGIAVTGFCGASAIVALLADLVNLLAVHLRLLHAVLRSLVANPLLDTWVCFGRLLRGTKFNVLRGRSDQFTELDVLQLTLGTVCFVLASFVLPPVLFYDVYFFVVARLVDAIRAALERAAVVVYHLPAYEVVTWLATSVIPAWRGATRGVCVSCLRWRYNAPLADVVGLCPLQAAYGQQVPTIKVALHGHDAGTSRPWEDVSAFAIDVALKPATLATYLAEKSVVE